MLDLTPATFEDFELEARLGNVVPVVRTVLADMHTPVGAFMRIAGDASHAFLLESIEGGERVARYSFLGANPWMIARGQGRQTVVERDGLRESHNQNAVEFLREYFAGKKLARRSGLAPLAGGAVGYLAYDGASWFEPVLEADGAVPGEPHDAVWMFFRTIVAFDRVRQQMEITSVVSTEDAGGDRDRLRALYQRAVAETKGIENSLNNALPAPPSSLRAAETTDQFESNWSRRDFEAAVETVKEHIGAGECYQVVVTEKFTKPTSAPPLG